VIATDDSPNVNTATQTVQAVLEPPPPGPPEITAAPAVTNALLQAGGVVIVVPGETNVFTVGAFDPARTALSYQWSFGDGTASDWSPLNTAAHAYAATNCGPYFVQVFVSNAYAVTTTNLTVAAACSLTVTKLQPKLDFAQTNRDSCAMTASLDLGAEFRPTGQNLVLDIGGVSLAFTLGKSGQGVLGASTVHLAYNKATALWLLTASLNKGSWRGAWAAYGLVNPTIKQTGTPVTMPVVVLVGDTAFATDCRLHYTATPNKTGTAK
jgi:hypothetical protein